MKKFLIIITLVLATLTVNIVDVKASQEYLMDIPNTITINNVERDVRIVSYEEYERDMSGDFLITLNYGNGSDILSLEELTSSTKSIKKVALWIGNQVAGYIVEKGLDYLVNSGIALNVVKGAVQFLATINWTWVTLIAIAAVTVYTIYKVATKNYSLQGIVNASNCVWSGPRVGGVWLCQARL